MNRYYPTLLSPHVLSNGVVLKNRMICPSNQPFTVQGAENFPTQNVIRQ